MSDLAAALGMKRPTLYWYFSGQESIFEAVVDETHERFITFIAARLHGVEHPIDYLEALVRAVVDFYDGRRDLIIVLFQLWAVSSSRDPERILERGRQWLEPMRAGLIARVQDGIDAGLVAPCDPQTVVDLALAVADGLQVHRVTRDAAPGPIVDGLRDLVLAPLRRDRRARTSRTPRRKSS